MRRSLPDRSQEFWAWLAGALVFFALYVGSWWLLLPLESLG
ncbi:MAG: hypothetical protein AAF648_06080 [Pseudomonadota bacterium]